MQITSEMVRDLREKTGAGMMDCKKALTDAAGDMEKAVDILRTKGLAAAAKKAGRIASEGKVAIAVSGASAAMAEINCETDFVAKTDDFLAFANEIAALIRDRNPKDVDAALALPAGGGTLADLLTEKIARIGEKISLRRFARFEVPAGEKGAVGSYIHGGGKIGVLVLLSGAEGAQAAEVGKDMAMQVAAASPQYVDRASVPAEVIAREKAIYMEQAKASGKPEKILDKIAQGKLEKFYGEACLVEQGFIKDPDQKVKALLAGAGVTVTGFVRFMVGEGMEKRSDDLAAEVAKQLGQKA